MGLPPLVTLPTDLKLGLDLPYATLTRRVHRVWEGLVRVRVQTPSPFGVRVLTKVSLGFCKPVFHRRSYRGVSFRWVFPPRATLLSVSSVAIPRSRRGRHGRSTLLSWSVLRGLHRESEQGLTDSLRVLIDSLRHCCRRPPRSRPFTPGTVPDPFLEVPKYPCQGSVDPEGLTSHT